MNLKEEDPKRGYHHGQIHKVEVGVESKVEVGIESKVEAKKKPCEDRPKEIIKALEKWVGKLDPYDPN